MVRSLACHDPFLHISASVPSCHGLFRSIGVGGAGDVIANQKVDVSRVTNILAIQRCLTGAVGDADFL